MTDLAVIILTKDEKLHIRRCLEHLAPLEPRQVFVVDCVSTDGTQEIVREFGVTHQISLVEREWPGLYAKQLNWAIDNLPIEAEWVLRLDADEYLYPDTIAELKRLLPKTDATKRVPPELPPDVTSLSLSRARVFCGRKIRFGGTAHIPMMRFFKFGIGRCQDRAMDEHIITSSGRDYMLKGEFADDNLNSMDWWREKHRGYAKREAVDAIAGEKFKPSKTLYYKFPPYFRAFAYFIYRYFFRLGFLDGRAGWMWHFWQGLWYRWLVDVEIGRLLKAMRGRKVSQPLRVLHVVPSLRTEDGGPSTSVPQTAMAQKAAGMEVGIAYFDANDLTDSAYEAEKSGVKMHPFRGSFSRLNRVKFSWDFLFRFRKVAAEYDIIVTHLNWMFPIWWAAHIARSLGKPYVMMPRGCLSPNAIKNAAWKKVLVGPLDRYAIRKAASVWATSQQEAEWIKEYEPEAKTEMLPMGLDSSKYYASRTKPQREKRLLFMSRISAIKALDMLAEAWAEVVRGGGAKGWKLVIVGPDDRGHVDKMKRLYAQTCPGGSYEFMDAVYGEAKAKLLSESSAFVLSSRSENWSVSISEGLASGLPVICTKGSPWGIIPEIGAGWRTEISVEGLKAAILEMASLSEETLHDMGMRGRKWVIENLDWSKVGSVMKGKLEELVVSC